MPSINYTVVLVEPFTHSPSVMLVERGPDATIGEMVREVLRRLGERFTVNSTALEELEELWQCEEMTTLLIPSTFPVKIGGTLTIFRNDSSDVPSLGVKAKGEIHHTVTLDSDVLVRLTEAGVARLAECMGGHLPKPVGEHGGWTAFKLGELFDFFGSRQSLKPSSGMFVDDEIRTFLF